VNGNLVIEGTRNLNVNSENQLITIRGVIRPIDLDTTNTVLSARLANMDSPSQFPLPSASRSAAVLVGVSEMSSPIRKLTKRAWIAAVTSLCENPTADRLLTRAARYVADSAARRNRAATVRERWMPLFTQTREGKKLRKQD
jgi:hypothetical protein